MRCLGVLLAMLLVLAAANSGLAVTVQTVHNDVIVSHTIDNYWWDSDSVAWGHENPLNGTVYDLALDRGLVSNVSLRIYTESWDTGSAPVQVTFTDAVGGLHGLGSLTQGAGSSVFNLIPDWLDHTSVKASLSATFGSWVGVHIEKSVLTVTYGTNDAPTAEAGGLYTLAVYDGLSATLDVSAVGSTDDGVPSPLEYAWDLDNDGTYDTGWLTSTAYSITDPLSWFGTTSGAKTIGLKVFDGEYYATDTATVDYTYTAPPPGPGMVPEPLTMAGLAMGIGSLATYLRKRK